MKAIAGTIGTGSLVSKAPATACRSTHVEEP
jgi:hypothetical protein